jgi:hypothetical protein
VKEKLGRRSLEQEFEKEIGQRNLTCVERKGEISICTEMYGRAEMDRRTYEQHVMKYKREISLHDSNQWTDITELRKLEVLWPTANRIKPKWARKRK